MTLARYLVADVFDGLATLEPASVDLVLTSPPFLALRSYLPAGHAWKGKEIGSEATPAAYLDTLLAVVEALDRVLAPHGSLVMELGDTYAGSGGGGGDYLPGGMREGQPGFGGSAETAREGNAAHWRQKNRWKSGGLADYSDQRGNPDGMRDTTFSGANTLTGGGRGWPLDKSLCGIPALFAFSLAYGRNLLRPERTTEPWRIRNVVAWCRPNPPVGALGDKFRPAVSYLTVATRSRQRYFDLDAVRGVASDYQRNGSAKDTDSSDRATLRTVNAAGAPPLDYWEIPTQPYAGKASTVRRVPCEPGDGGERTTSPDCPVHAGLPGQLPKALRDAHADRRWLRTPGSDGRPAPEQLPGFAPPDLPLEPSHVVDSSDSEDPRCAPVATAHSTASSRTDLVPSTNPAGMPSEETTGRTDGIPASPSSVAPDRGTPSSSIGVACLSADGPGTPLHTPDISDPSSACTCSYWKTVTESTSHYATWPEQLCVVPIKAMCPLRVCEMCGEPSRRIVELITLVDGKPVDDSRLYGSRFGGDRASTTVDGRGQKTTPSRTGIDNNRVTTSARTLGWTDCPCACFDCAAEDFDGEVCEHKYRTGVVLDPFAGSGTTLAVATGHGRDAIGIDLDARNADLARDRVGPLLFELVEA